MSSFISIQTTYVEFGVECAHLVPNPTESCSSCTKYFHKGTFHIETQLNEFVCILCVLLVPCRNPIDLTIWRPDARIPHVDHWKLKLVSSDASCTDDAHAGYPGWGSVVAAEEAVVGEEEHREDQRER